MRFNVDLFKNVGLIQYSKKEAAMIVAGSMVCGSVMMFMMFYGILHCWLNATAELLRFGDREFYQVSTLTLFCSFFTAYPPLSKLYIFFISKEKCFLRNRER